MPELKWLFYPKWDKDHINGFKQNVRLVEQTGKILQSRKLGYEEEQSQGFNRMTLCPFT